MARGRPETSLNRQGWNFPYTLQKTVRTKKLDLPLLQGHLPREFILCKVCSCACPQTTADLEDLLCRLLTEPLGSRKITLNLPSENREASVMEKGRRIKLQNCKKLWKMFQCKEVSSTARVLWHSRKTTIVSCILHQVFKPLWVCPVDHKNCCMESYTASPNRTQSLLQRHQYISTSACWLHQQLLASKKVLWAMLSNSGREPHVSKSSWYAQVHVRRQDLKSFLDSRDQSHLYCSPKPCWARKSSCLPQESVIPVAGNVPNSRHFSRIIYQKRWQCLVSSWLWHW